MYSTRRSCGTAESAAETPAAFAVVLLLCVCDTLHVTLHMQSAGTLMAADHTLGEKVITEWPSLRSRLASAIRSAVRARSAICRRVCV